MKPTDLQPSKMMQLRRSQRVCLNLPITVLREGPGNNVASEETTTLIVNAHGALIQVALTVEIGQLLGNKNTQTMEELVCRVVSLGLGAGVNAYPAVVVVGLLPRFSHGSVPGECAHGGGALGRFIVDGLALREFDQLFAGAMLVALLAIVTEITFSALERASRAPGMIAIR